MDDPGTFEQREVPLYDEAARSLVVDEQAEMAIQADTGDGHQAVVRPPIGTVGGPQARPGEEGTTPERTVSGGGGPADRGGTM